MKKPGILFLFLLLIISCDNNTMNERSPTEIPMEEDMVVSSNIDIEKPKIPAERKIIWRANLEFQVKDVDKSTKEISNICSKYEAFISHMDMTSTNYEISNQITIRVNNEYFNKLINDIKGTSTFIRKVEISSNDVTEEFIDIESRLKTKKEVRERYIDILRNRAGEIKDVIAAEDAIRKITEEIEAKEGRLRYLQDIVSQSTIVLGIYQKVDYKSEPETYEKGFFTKAKESLETGWDIITGFFLLLLKIWPILLIVVIILIWRRKWFKKKIRK
ncbi:DUF4349 domain-containing protein [Zhouia amylolytica]|uniref:DUF4349 domain-containing protein n=1 Tax=Zhouia amylolytica AD3 TaxID=1286632 RepID=W2UQZ4_9FLAO|nr:DUF4349 domain-containing protein [Zhouia amylolytica]ETN96585.1 hypothetical protein P278_00110 [Zhouia amylolytica AD3]